MSRPVMTDHHSYNFNRTRTEAARVARDSLKNFRPLSMLSPSRHSTSDVNRVEQGLGDDEDGIERLSRMRTAPEPSPIPEDGTHRDRLSKELESSFPHRDASGDANGDANGDQSHTVGSEETATDTTNELRNRKPRIEGDAAPDEDRPKPRRKKTGILKHVEPKEPFTFRNQLERTLLSSWINVLLFAAPAGIACYATGVNGSITFAINFIAIIPLAAMLSFATEEIALRTGETIGGLINATFGNAVELIVAVIALATGQVKIVQTSLIGSILSNLLLVLGMCFFAGGMNRRVQFFNKTVAQTAASLLALAVASAIVPTVFEVNPDFENLAHTAAISRGTAVILLIVYGGYLLFQLKTHATVFNEESQKADIVSWRKKSTEGVHALAQAGGQMVGPHTGEPLRENLLHMRPQTAVNPDDEDDDEGPQLHIWVAVGTLTASTVIIAFCAEFMVDSISALTDSGALTQEFVGLILLPIVGNAAEHVTAVTVAIKDKMDLAIGVAVGSSMQVALFLIPLLVIIGWIMGNQAMTMAYDTFQVAVLFVAVLLVNYLIADGESHWLEGMLLVCLYAIIAVCAFYYPISTGGTG